MKRALELAALLAVLCSGSAIADEPGFGESELPVISPVENSGNSLPVLAEARRPPAEVPASRAARAEWQRRLEQRQLERQRRDEESTQVDPARPNKGDDSRKTPARRNRKSRGKTEIRKPSPEKPADPDTSKKSGSKKPDSKKPDGKKKPQQKPNPDKADPKGKPDSKNPAIDKAKKDDVSDLPLIVPQSVHIPSYAAVRGTIPFSRSEWEADPTYRHNATMELMLGQLRDMVVYRYPPMGGPMAPGSGVTINNGGGGRNSQYGYGGFGGIPFGFNPGLNGVIQSRRIINSFQTQGFIGRGGPVLP